MFVEGGDAFVELAIAGADIVSQEFAGRRELQVVQVVA